MCMVLKRVCPKQANRVVIIPMIMVRVFGMYVRVVRHFITDEVIAAVPVATIVEVWAEAVGADRLSVSDRSNPITRNTIAFRLIRPSKQPYGR